jgi:hypothetical protein
MGIEENMTAIGRFLSQEVFFGEEENLTVVDEVFLPDVVFSGVPGDGEEVLHGTDAINAIKRELRSYRDKEGELAIRAQIAAGDLVATGYTLKLEEPEEPVKEFEGITVSRFAANGMIREYRVDVAREGDDRKAAHN